MLRAITLAICSYTILLTAFALPGRPAQANVALFNLPSALTPPGKPTLRYVYQGFGTQNYTCNATSGTYQTSGTASAELVDVTKFYTGNTAPATLPAIQTLDVVGHHFFVPNPLTPGSNAPLFQNEHAFMIGVKNASVASTEPTYSVAALLVANIGQGKGGDLADFVVRTDVVGGVVPSVLNTCTGTDVIAIPYKAHYLFFKS